jgi:hypothetical protein
VQENKRRVKVENMMLMNDVNVGIIGLFSRAMMHTYIHTSFQNKK